MRKRFIAGAFCPHCQKQDTLVVWQENQRAVAECVRCGHRSSEATKKPQEQQRDNKQIIRLFSSE